MFTVLSLACVLNAGAFAGLGGISHLMVIDVEIDDIGGDERDDTHVDWCIPGGNREHAHVQGLYIVNQDRIWT